MLETLQQIDQEIFLFFNGIASPFWDQFMLLFTAKLTWIPLYAALLFVIWKNFNTGALILSVIVIALTITFADQVCASLIRPVVERLRPSNANSPISEYVYLVNGKRGGRYGFPSCHAANTFALAFIVFFLFKKRSLNICFFTWAAVNSYSRIYIGVHYPGDLLAGLLVGLTGAWLFFMLYRKLHQSPKITQFMKIVPKDKEIIERHLPLRYADYIAYTGLLTVLVFCIYSCIKIY